MAFTSPGTVFLLAAVDQEKNEEVTAESVRRRSVTESHHPAQCSCWLQHEGGGGEGGREGKGGCEFVTRQEMLEAF
jgi:hypothetical protein